MNDSKIIIHAEITVKPEYLEDVIALSKATLVPTLQEPGCEVFYQTVKADSPGTLVFFEVFTSKAALDLHLTADYTKTFFEGVKGKLSGQPIQTILNQL